MKEIWKEIEGYGGAYSVSNFGNVLSNERTVRYGNQIRTVPKHLMEKRDNGHGYLIVQLNKNNKRKNHYVHRLVALAFIGPSPSAGHEVNHKDFNKQNNNVDNLEWMTSAENSRYSKPNYKKTSPLHLSSGSRLK